jgi:hypothetical protein
MIYSERGFRVCLVVNKRRKALFLMVRRDGPSLCFVTFQDSEIITTS